MARRGSSNTCLGGGVGERGLEEAEEEDGEDEAKVEDEEALGKDAVDGLVAFDSFANLSSISLATNGWIDAGDRGAEIDLNSSA